MNRQGIYVNGMKVFDPQGQTIKNIQIINGSVQTVIGINKGSISMTTHNHALMVDGQTIELPAEPVINIEVFGNVAHLNSNNGDVHITGNAEKIDTVSGDVSITGNVTSHVETVSGDVHCQSVSGRVETVSGDIYHR